MSQCTVTDLMMSEDLFGLWLGNKYYVIISKINLQS